MLPNGIIRSSGSGMSEVAVVSLARSTAYDGIQYHLMWVFGENGLIQI